MDSLKYCAYELLTFATQKMALVYALLIQFLNSEFGTAAVGSFFGAVGGYAMVMITDRRKEILSKIGALKAAISLSHTLFNNSYGLYSQHIKSLYAEYERDRKKFIEALKKSTAGEKVIFDAIFDNKQFLFPPIDFNLVNSKLMEKTDLSRRAFILATTLVNSFITLKELMQQRQNFLRHIANLAEKHKLNDTEKAHLYYGTRFSHPTLGNITEESFVNIMQGINNFNVDCTWFAKELTDELIKVSKKTCKEINNFKTKNWFCRLFRYRPKAIT